MAFVGLTFQLGTVLWSGYDDDDVLGVQVDTAGDTGSAPLEMLHQHGFASRPLDPDVDAATQTAVGCVVQYAYQGSGQGFAWVSGDPRSLAKVPRLQKGESIQYGPQGNFVRCHADGSISLATTDDGTFDGRSIFLRVLPTGLVFSFPFGRLTFDATGFHVLHSSGARIDLGAIGGMPAPLDALNSYATLSARMVSLQGSATSLGTDAGLTNQTAVAALLVEIGLLRAALASLGAVIPTPISPLISQIGAVV